MSPETVAEYARKDSRALSKVDSSDLLDELLVRLVESASLPAEDLYKETKGLISKYEERAKEDKKSATGED